MKNTFFIFLSIVLVFYFSFNLPRLVSTIDNVAGVFFVQSITVADLQNTYKKASKRKDRVKILLVAGHEPNYGGAEFRGIKERDIAVDIAEEIQKLLDEEPEYKTVINRDKENWNPEIEQFFKDEWDEIIPWKESYQREMIRLFNNGKVKQVTDGVPHNDAPPDVARRLYGINKWVNENGFDIVIHIHINDNPRKKRNLPGVYSGYAIYIPEGQYSNAEATKAIAEKIEARFAQVFTKSNLPKENTGLIEDQELVAIGRHNTVDAVSLLIEYGYIYEAWIQDPALREINIKEMARQTVLGIKDFF